jgi:hypothetical protein
MFRIGRQQAGDPCVAQPSGIDVDPHDSRWQRPQMRDVLTHSTADVQDATTGQRNLLFD